MSIRIPFLPLFLSFSLGVCLLACVRVMLPSSRVEKRSPLASSFPLPLTLAAKLAAESNDQERKGEKERAKNDDDVDNISRSDDAADGDDDRDDSIERERDSKVHPFDGSTGVAETKVPFFLSLSPDDSRGSRVQSFRWTASL